MRTHQAAVAVLFTLLLVAPAAMAAAPSPLNFNGKPAADLPGRVNAVSVDGGGTWAAAAVVDGGVSVTGEDRDLYMFNLNSESPSWEAIDGDLVHEGGMLVVVANGTRGQEGQWLMLVNNSVPSVLTAYRTSGFSANRLGMFAWQFDPETGPIRDVAINADGTVVALASDGASATGGGGSGSASTARFILLKNREGQGPHVMYTARSGSGDFDDVTEFTAVALAMNTTVPSQPTTTRPVFSVVGAETTLNGGLVFLFQHTFSNSLDNPSTRLLASFDTGSPVTRVAITSDGEYAVVGTASGGLFLISVREALVLRGAQGLAEQPLGPWQGSLGSAIRSLDIAPFGGRYFAAGTDAGELGVFRNLRNAAGNQGARAVELGSVTLTSVPCGTDTLRAPVASLALSDFGHHLVVGARRGMAAFEVGALDQGRPGPLEAAWCVPLATAETGVQNPGVKVDMSGDGLRVFAAADDKVVGYRNFYAFSVAADADRKVGTPGQRVQWAVTVSNDGSLFDRVNLSLQGPDAPGWSFDVSPSTLPLQPGTSRTVLVNVTSPPDSAPGNFSLNLAGRPETAGGSAAIAKRLQLDLGRLRRVEILPPEGVLVASQGVPNTFPISVRNTGNANDRFRLFAEIPEPVDVNKSPGSDWAIRVEPFELDIPGRETRTVDLQITPQAASRGDSVNVRIRVEATVPEPDGSLPRDEKTLRVAVEPEYRGDLALADGREPVVEPGQMVIVNLTVRNLGNTRDVFALRNHTEPANAPGWRVQLGDERFELRKQNDQKTVRMAVTAQRGLQPGESVQVVVELFSEGLVIQVPGSDGQVDSQSVLVTVVAPEERGLPAAPGPLVLVGLLALALAARRRRE